jgi:hypothetical protein
MTPRALPYAGSRLPARSPEVSSAESLREMSERRHRFWSRWAGQGALAIGTLAALALAITVLFAQKALNDAADVVIRGDGDTLVSSIVVDLWEAESLTSETLALVLQKHEARRLRYVGLLDRQDHHAVAEAGAATIVKGPYMPGETFRQGRRVRFVATTSSPKHASPTTPASTA